MPFIVESGIRIDRHWYCGNIFGFRIFIKKFINKAAQIGPVIVSAAVPESGEMTGAGRPPTA